MEAVLFWVSDQSELTHLYRGVYRYSILFLFEWLYLVNSYMQLLLAEKCVCSYWYPLQHLHWRGFRYRLGPEFLKVWFIQLYVNAALGKTKTGKVLRANVFIPGEITTKLPLVVLLCTFQAAECSVCGVCRHQSCLACVCITLLSYSLEILQPVNFQLCSALCINAFLINRTMGKLRESFLHQEEQCGFDSKQ